MDLKTLADNFGILLDAPGAVDKLRTLIFDLAIQGKLLPQSPSEESTAVLISKIGQVRQDDSRVQSKQNFEAAAFVKNGVPFQIPNSWEWTTLGFIGRIFNGNSVSETRKLGLSRVSDGLPFVATKDVGYGFDQIKYDNGLRVAHNDPLYKVAHSGAVLVCSEGGSAGKKCGITDRNICFGNKLYANECWDGVYPKYILTYYQTDTFYQQFAQRMTGIIGGIALSEFLTIPIPLPPTAEQHRIVAKVDQLMQLCDELEQKQEKVTSTRNKLNTVSLEKLVAARNAEEFEENWERVKINFPNYFTSHSALKEFKILLVDLAIQGKLDAAKSDDVSALNLLAAIKADRVRQNQIKKYQKIDALEPLTSADVPFQIPEDWAWCRLGQITNVVTSGSRDWAKHYSESGAIFVRMGNLSRGSFNLRMDEIQYVRPPQGSEGSRTRLEEGDILVSITGEVGNLGLIPKNFGEAYINQHTALVRLDSRIYPKYIAYCFLSRHLQAQFNAPQRGVKNSFRLSDIDYLTIPLPPLATQKNIVHRLEKWLDLCLTIEKQLSALTATTERLMLSCFKSALAIGSEHAHLSHHAHNGNTSPLIVNNLMEQRS